MENFLDVLIEKLVAMKAANEQPNVGDVIKLVIATAIDQKIPFDAKKSILQAILALDGITPDEAELLRDLNIASND